MELELEKVAAAAFLDELSKILQPAEHEKIASYFHGYALNQLSLEGVADMIKEAGFFDRAKNFMQGAPIGVGPNGESGVPMHSLSGMLSQSNPLQGMGSGIANAGSAIKGKLQGAAGAVGNFLRGGEQNGIPMHSLGGQLAESNPLTGMGSSIASSARQAGGAIAGKLQGAGQAVGSFLRGSPKVAESMPGAAVGAPPRSPPPLPAAAARPAARPMPPPLPAAARGAGGGGGGMFGALMQGMQGAKSNPLASMHLGG